MKNLIYGFSGPSNSGKTTLIKNIIKILMPQKITVLKHDPKSKAEIDTKGKDSDIFYNTGADVIIYSPKETTLRIHGALPLTNIIQQIGQIDYLFIEGLKELPIPKLAVMREKIETHYFDYVDAIALTKNLSTQDIPKHINILPIENLSVIIEYINKNALPLSQFKEKQ